MEYTVLSKEDQNEMLRRHLLQAEADHFQHSLQLEEVAATLAALPAKPGSGNDPQADKRAKCEADKKQLEEYRDTAEAKANILRQKVEEIPAEPAEEETSKLV